MGSGKKNVGLTIVKWTALAVFLVSSSVLGWQLYTDYKDNENYDTMATEFVDEVEEEIIIVENADETEEEGDSEPTVVSYVHKKVDLQSLHAKNAEAIGWISIAGTPVNYAVMQAGNNDKYLNLSATGGRSAAGAIFADAKCGFSPQDTNVTLYGHNMGRGKTTMFSSLLNYGKQSYYNAHPYIQFDTIYGTGVWKIFSAFQVDVMNTTYNYSQRQFLNKNGFDEFVATGKSMSYVSTDITPRYGDKTLVLSTCDRSKNGANGRFIVMAVLVGGTLMGSPAPVN